MARDRRWLCSLVVAAAGCRSIIGLEEPLSLDALTEDAPPPDGGAWCFTHGLALCASTPPEPALVVTTDMVLDTAVMCSEVVPRMGGPALCLVFRDSLVITEGNRLNVVGSRPLVLATTGPIFLDGEIVVSTGATASATGCSFAQVPVISTGGSGGGAGGTFGRAGGNGGTGSAMGLGLPGLASPAGMPSSQDVRAGCPGQDGAGGAPGGQGGGAVWLLSQADITLAKESEVIAGGGGGGGGAVATGGGGGGGGGGAGGLIGLGAPRVAVDGTLAANGGGGGGGGGGVSAGLAGAAGGRSMLAGMGGGGGAGSSGTIGGGAGGAGGAGVTEAVAGAPGADGGGGGGGSVGVIWLGGEAVSATTARISPPPSIAP